MKPNKIIATLVVIGLFIIPIIPLVVTNSLFFPFITGKAFTFRIVVEIVTALWLALLLVDKQGEYAVRRSWISGAVVLFTFVTLLADIFAFNTGKAFWSNYERMEGWVTIIHLALYFLVTTTVFTTTKMWKRYFNAFLAISTILCVYGLFQLGGKLDIHQGGTRLDATLGNSAYLAVYLLINFFISAYMFLQSKKKRTAQWLYGILAVFELVILYYTGTRGSLLGLLAGFFVWILLTILFERHNKKLRNGAIAFLALLLIMIGVFEASKQSAFVKKSPTLSRLAAITLADAAPRLAIWNMAFQGFKEKPLLGWGQDNFNYVFNKYYEPSMYTQEQWFDRAHNVFFDWLIAGGLLALLSYLFLFLCAFWYIWKKNAPFTLNERAIFTALFVSYFIHNLFVFDNLVSYILFFTLLGFLHHEYKGKPVAIFSKIRIHPDIQNLVVLPVIFIVALAVIYQVNIKPMNAAAALIGGLTPQRDAATNLDYFKQALAYNSFGHQEIREQLVATAQQVKNASNVNDATKQAFYAFTRSEMEKELALNPNDARENIFLGAFLDRYSLLNEALPYLEKAVSLSPNKQTILFELGTNYISAQKYDLALQTFKRAYDLDHRYDEARILYAVALVYNGKLNEATDVLGKDKNLLTTDQRFINAYAATKNFSKLLAIYQDKLKENPTDAQTRVSLAAVYLAMGNRIEAILQLQKAIELNPAFKDQGTYYINEIRAGRNP